MIDYCFETKPVLCVHSQARIISYWPSKTENKNCFHCITTSTWTVLLHSKPSCSNYFLCCFTKLNYPKIFCFFYFIYFKMGRFVVILFCQHLAYGFKSNHKWDLMLHAQTQQTVNLMDITRVCG